MYLEGYTRALNKLFNSMVIGSVHVYFDIKH